VIELEFCEGKRMRADILTKGESGRVFNEMAGGDFEYIDT
jgi:hypothetical protein